mmetsp:Transcript_116773/g.203121  ORF Transcript_116773/g.203121 Transcript_116773/m.203121 type:complete len:139 (-) Transcript_116773:2320-2736(-)
MCNLASSIYHQSSCNWVRTTTGHASQNFLDPPPKMSGAEGLGQVSPGRAALQWVLFSALMPEVDHGTSAFHCACCVSVMKDHHDGMMNCAKQARFTNLWPPHAPITILPCFTYSRQLCPILKVVWVHFALPHLSWGKC